MQWQYITARIHTLVHWVLFSGYRLQSAISYTMKPKDSLPDHLCSSNTTLSRLVMCRGSKSQECEWHWMCTYDSTSISWKLKPNITLKYRHHSRKPCREHVWSIPDVCTSWSSAPRHWPAHNLFRSTGRFHLNKTRRPQWDAGRIHSPAAVMGSRTSLHSNSPTE